MKYVYPLLAAFLFALSMPAGKKLLDGLRPLEISSLCYLGSGLGLLLWRLLVSGGGAEAPLGKKDLPYTFGFVLAGGVLAPLLLFSGLRLTASSSASMFLNFELLFTSLIAVLIFREPGGARFWAAAALITAGGCALSFDGGGFRPGPGALLVLASSLMWGVDNNLTARVSMKDPVKIGAIKGLAGGLVNGGLAYYAYGGLPQFKWACAALLLGFASYGVSLVLFILGMRELGASRSGAFFGVYPFIGAVVSVLMLGERVTPGLLWAGGLMIAAFVLLAVESHAHAHRHEPLEHEHSHVHGDGHHGHVHAELPPGPHSHPHRHDAQEHAHPHYPDEHHRHRHC